MDPRTVGTATEIGLTLAPDAEVGSPHTSVASLGVDEVRKDKEGTVELVGDGGVDGGEKGKPPMLNNVNEGLFDNDSSSSNDTSTDSSSGDSESSSDSSDSSSESNESEEDSSLVPPVELKQCYGEICWLCIL